MFDPNTYYQGRPLNLLDPEMYKYHFYLISDPNGPILNAHFPLVFLHSSGSTGDHERHRDHGGIFHPCIIYQELTKNSVLSAKHDF